MSDTPPALTPEVEALALGLYRQYRALIEATTEPRAAHGTIAILLAAWLHDWSWHMQTTDEETIEYLHTCLIPAALSLWRDLHTKKDACDA